MVDGVGMRRLRPALLAMACGLAAASATAARGDDPPPGHDLTYRPTVMVRRGTSQGSGTVIASVARETLVLTAAHVLEAEGAPSIEVHRYNLGLERRRTAEGFPRVVPARIVATDKAADLAVLRVSGFEAMPYVARLAPGDEDPAPGRTVVSVGIDLGAKLTSWGTRVVDSVRIDMGKGGGDRPFLLVDKPPEHGRSGGGLFATDGTVVGVCIGRAEIVRGKRLGVFASGRSIRRLLREHDLDAAVARSIARRSTLPGPVDRARGAAPAAPVPAPPPPALGRASPGG